MARAISPVDIARAGTVPAHPPLTYGNRVQALTDGTAATMAHLAWLIETAEDEILLQVYQWHDHDASAVAVVAALQRRLARALLEPRLHGPLRVHIVVNGTWPTETSTSQHALLAMIHALAAAPLAVEHVQMELASFGGFGLAVLHSKSAIVDERRGLLMTGNLLTKGGLATDFYNAGMGLTGPVAAVLRDDWREARGRSAVVAQSVSGMQVPAVLHHTTSDAGAAADAGVPAAVLTKQASWSPMAGVENPQDRGMLALIDTATQSIRAMNPALNATPITRALTDAAKRGVLVQLVLSLNMDRWEQLTLFGGDNAEAVYWMYRTLLAYGGPTAADKLRVRWPSSDGQHPAPDGDSVNVHAKAALFDAGCLWLGSMNWDFLSWVTSRELSVAMFGDYTYLFNERLFDGVLRRSVPIRATDLPFWAQHAGDPVYGYVRNAGM